MKVERQGNHFQIHDHDGIWVYSTGPMGATELRDQLNELLPHPDNFLYVREKLAAANSALDRRDKEIATLKAELVSLKSQQTNSKTVRFVGFDYSKESSPIIPYEPPIESAQKQINEAFGLPASILKGDAPISIKRYSGYEVIKKDVGPYYYYIEDGTPYIVSRRLAAKDFLSNSAKAGRVVMNCGEEDAVMCMALYREHGPKTEAKTILQYIGACNEIKPASIPKPSPQSHISEYIKRPDPVITYYRCDPETALRGNLEKDTLEAGIKPADSALSNAWRFQK